MEKKRSRYEDIVVQVKNEHPTVPNSEFARLVRERIKMIEATDSPVLEPINTATKLTDRVREQAGNISQRSNLLVQFVRPKGRKAIGATVNFATGEIKKILAKKQPTGALVAFRDGSEIIIGWSKYHKIEETEPFSKKNATLIAIMRGLTDGIRSNEKGFYETTTGRALPRDINKGLTPFVNRARAYFKSGLRNMSMHS